MLDGGNVIAEQRGDTLTAYYARGVNLFASFIGNTTNFYLYNAHGDVVQLTGENGAVTKTYEYDAFGNEQDPSAADTNPFRYCGEYYDAETDTYYLRARYYDPMIGRMIAEDPAWNYSNRIYGEYYYADTFAILQSGNLYVYCNGNPILFIDPFGFEFYSSGFNTSANAYLGLFSLFQFYAGTNNVERPNLDVGAMVNASGNLVTFGKAEDLYDIHITCVEASGGLGLGYSNEKGLQSVGSVNLNLVSLNGSIIVPIPFADYQVEISGSANLGVGATVKSNGLGLETGVTPGLGGDAGISISKTKPTNTTSKTNPTTTKSTTSKPNTTSSHITTSSTAKKPSSSKSQPKVPLVTPSTRKNKTPSLSDYKNFLTPQIKLP